VGSGDRMPRRTAANATTQGVGEHAAILVVWGCDGWSAHRRQFGRRYHAGEQRRGGEKELTGEPYVSVTVA
jgi:formylmethanofuran dehydrogenase subunit B